MREFKTGDKVRLDKTSPYPGQHSYLKKYGATHFVVTATRMIPTVYIVQSSLNGQLEHFHWSRLIFDKYDLFTIIDDHIKSLEQS